MHAAPVDELQLPHLETFSKVAELGSFTGAAKVLRLSQAAVSQRIHALERTVGKPLFQRYRAGTLLTGHGQKLYEYAQRILDLHREARRQVTGLGVPVAGELFLAASSIPGEHLLPALLCQFRQEYSQILVHASISDSAAVMTQVEHGDVSFGLVGRKADNPHFDFRYLTSDKMVLIVPRRHPLSKRKTIVLKQFLNYPLVLREVGSGLRHCFEKSLQKAGHAPADLHIALELGSNEAIKDAVLRGAGIAVISSFAVQKELKSRRLHALEITDLQCDRDIFVVHDRRRVLAPPARLFLTFLETHPVSACT